MKYCPITYEPIKNTEIYSQRGLKKLSPQLTQLNVLAYSAQEQRMEAITYAGKMSIQGVQPKLSAILKVNQSRFELVDQFGQYILKPQNEHYAQLPENEATTMSMAALIGLNVPVHGLLYAKDNSMTYFIKRFDRMGIKKKYAVEDFAQLAQLSRETKYNSSMEQVLKIIYKYCSFPKIVAANLLKLTLFNFLTGNEDMHLKNFSLIVRNQQVTLAPCYDLLNTTIAQKNPQEELALPLNGKKNNLTRADFIEYFAIEKMGLNTATVENILDTLRAAYPEWLILLARSFMTKEKQEQYKRLLEQRSEKLKLFMN